MQKHWTQSESNKNNALEMLQTLPKYENEKRKKKSKTKQAERMNVQQFYYKLELKMSLESKLNNIVFILGEKNIHFTRFAFWSNQI